MRKQEKSSAIRNKKKSLKILRLMFPFFIIFRCESISTSDIVQHSLTSSLIAMSSGLVFFLISKSAWIVDHWTLWKPDDDRLFFHGMGTKKILSKPSRLMQPEVEYKEDVQTLVQSSDKVYCTRTCTIWTFLLVWQNENPKDGVRKDVDYKINNWEENLEIMTDQQTDVHEGS